MKRIAAAGAIAAVATALLITFAAGSVRLGPTANRRSASDAEATRGLLGLLDNYDGGDYAAIGRDPTLARPDIYPTREEAAYREQRPLFGELAWIGSLGNPDRVPITMAVLSVLAATFAVMALGAVLMRRGISPFFALGVFALPAVPTTVYDMMPELLQLGLLTVGLLLWESHPRRHSGWAIAAFSLAALTRESSLLVPLTLIAFELPRIRARPTLSTIRLLTIPFLVYASWITFVYARVGAWPFHSPSGGLTVVPFGGLVRALAHSSDRTSTALWFAVGVCMLGGAVLRGRRDAWLGTVIAFAVMAVFMGSTVWQRPDYFGRVLLPLYAYGVLIVASALWERRAFVSLHRARSPARSRVS